MSRASWPDFYYDGAGGFNLPVQIPAVKGIGSPAKLLYGSDYPFTPACPSAVRCWTIFETRISCRRNEKVGMLRKNALDLFPRFS